MVLRVLDACGLELITGDKRIHHQVAVLDIDILHIRADHNGLEHGLVGLDAAGHRMGEQFVAAVDQVSDLHQDFPVGQAFAVLNLVVLAQHISDQGIIGDDPDSVGCFHSVTSAVRGKNKNRVGQHEQILIVPRPVI